MECERIIVIIVALFLLIIAIRKACRSRFIALQIYYLRKRRNRGLMTLLLELIGESRRRGAIHRPRRAAWVYPRPQGWWPQPFPDISHGFGETREHWQNIKGTREHEPIFSNRGTKIYKLEGENMVSKLIKRGTNKENVWEHGNIGQFGKEQENKDPPGRPSFLADITISQDAFYFLMIYIHTYIYTYVHTYIHTYFIETPLKRAFQSHY